MLRDKLERKSKYFWNTYKTPLLYGKVDHDFNSVFPSETYLKSFGSSHDPILLLNFVADAFEDLLEFYNRKSSQNKLVKSGLYSKLVPANGWTGINRLYHDHMQIVYKKFFEIYMLGKHKQIKDFYNFVNEFKKFIILIQPAFPFTRTQFCLSSKTSPFISGLSVSLSRQSYEFLSSMKYLKDPNFLFFHESALSFGFMVDIFSPWRIIADIDSPYMEPYMRNHEFSKKNLFDEPYFYKAFKIELETFKVMVQQFYNSYITAMPGLYVPQLCNNKIITRKISRQIVEDVDNDSFWLELLFYVRIIETNRNWPDHKLKNKTKYMLEIQKTLDTNRALFYINDETKPLELGNHIFNSSIINTR